MPAVSVLIPAHRAAATLGTTLENLARQSHADFEVVLVQSGPDQLGEAELKARLPRLKHVSLPEKRMPHPALNIALSEARADRFALTDADAYPSEDWLAGLLAALDERGPVVYGAVACYGTGWVDQGAHLCKFDKWLPGGRPQILTEGPTVNMGIERHVFEDVGRFAEYTIHGDTEFAWRLRRRGYKLWSAPQAVVAHHHLHSVADLTRERFARGRSFGEFEQHWTDRGRSQQLVRAGVSLLPLRLVSQLLRVHGNAARAGMAGSFWRSLPIVAAGLYGWLLGEASALAKGPGEGSANEPAVDR